MSGLRLTFYADDFTGATDALESLTAGGVVTALFLEPPGTDDLNASSGLEAVGVAGNTRSMAVDDQRGELRRAFASLAALEAPLCHYKVCSTFDSSATIGSIGAAIEEGRAVFGGEWVPLLVGVPALGRWTIFGHHFARVGADGPVERLDRHPVAEHPVTPMPEADLLRHLGDQTDLRGANVVTHLASVSAPAAQVEHVRERGAEVVLFDVADEIDLEAAGAAIWSAAKVGEVRFAVGSSGIGYALAGRWQSLGELVGQGMAFADPADRVVVFSGSCSSVTGGQIAWATGHGWGEIALDTPALVAGSDDELAAAAAGLAEVLEHGVPVIVHTAQGPADPRMLANDRVDRVVAGALGALAERAVRSEVVDRVVLIGGDTCSGVARRLGIRSVRAVARTVAGAPLCIADAPGRAADGLEFVFKGGGLGDERYLERMAVAASPASGYATGEG